MILEVLEEKRVGHFIWNLEILFMLETMIADINQRIDHP